MSCKIKLESSQPFYPGDRIYGKVICNFYSTEYFKGIRCKLIGTEHTGMFITPERFGDNQFLLRSITFVGEGCLEPGRYVYPFSFILPRMGLPNPYRGAFGYIRYCINARIEKRDKKLEYEDTVPLKLLCLIDFNIIRHVLQLEPVRYQEEKHLYSCCCSVGLIVMNLYLEKEAFVLGEKIHVKIDVINKSTHNVDKVEIKIKQIIESKIISPKQLLRYENKVLYEISTCGVTANDRKTCNFSIVLPKSTHIPNFAGCTLFKHWYPLEVKAITQSSDTIKIVRLIKIGHIPIDVCEPQNILPEPVSISHIPEGPPPLSPLFNPNNYSFATREIPPPYVAESSRIALDELENGGDKKWSHLAHTHGRNYPAIPSAPIKEIDSFAGSSHMGLNRLDDGSDKQYLHLDHGHEGNYSASPSAPIKEIDLSINSNL